MKLKPFTIIFSAGCPVICLVILDTYLHNSVHVMSALSSKFLKNVQNTERKPNFDSFLSSLHPTTFIPCPKPMGCRAPNAWCGLHTVKSSVPCSLCQTIHDDTGHRCNSSEVPMYFFGRSACAAAHLEECISFYSGERISKEALEGLLTVCGESSCDHMGPVLHLEDKIVETLINRNCTHFMAIPVSSRYMRGVPIFWNLFSQESQPIPTGGDRYVSIPIGSNMICADDYEHYLMNRFKTPLFVYGSVCVDRESTFEGKRDLSANVGCLTVDIRQPIKMMTRDAYSCSASGRVKLKDVGRPKLVDESFETIFLKNSAPIYQNQEEWQTVIDYIIGGSFENNLRYRYYIMSGCYPEPSLNPGLLFDVNCSVKLYAILQEDGVFMKKFCNKTSITRVSIFDELHVCDPAKTGDVGNILFPGKPSCAYVTILNDCEDDTFDEMFYPESLCKDSPTAILHPGDVLRVPAGTTFQVVVVSGFLRISEKKVSDEFDDSFYERMLSRGYVRSFIPKRCPFCVPYPGRPKVSRGIENGFNYSYGDDVFYLK